MNIQITNGMLMALILNMVYSKAIGLTQGIMARQAGGDIWMATLLSAVQGLIMVLLTIWVVKRAPELNILEQCGKLLGSWVGKAAGIRVVCFFGGAFCSITITFVFHLRDYFLPEFPTFLFISGAVAVCLYGLYHGLEVIARLALIGVLFIITFNILMIMGSMQRFELDELMPVFQSGFVNTLWVSRHNDADWGVAALMAGMILPYVKDQKQWMNTGTASVIYGVILVVLWPILELGILSAEMTAQYILSCMQMARSAEMGQFIHRYEMLMIALFVVPILIQLMMCIFCAATAAKHVFALKGHRSALIPVSLIFGSLGYWLVLDHVRAMTAITYYWPPLALPIAVGLPAVLFIMGFFMKKKLSQVRK